MVGYFKSFGRLTRFMENSDSVSLDLVDLRYGSFHEHKNGPATKGGSGLGNVI
jgi:hypothetical protein